MSYQCKECRAPISAKTLSVSCDNCSNVYHIKCANISKAQYENISATPGCVWKCTACNDNTGEMAKSFDNEQLLKAIETLNQTVAMLKEEVKALKAEKDHVNMEVIISEISERQKRSNNIIIFKLKESNEDMKTVIDIIKNIAPNVATDEITINRLGKKHDNSPAPLKVKLGSRDDVFAILKNKRKLRETHPTISIGTDQTKLQQEYFKRIKGELERRKDTGETNLFIKYINGVPTITKSKNE
uniref:PHD-type domain-containing protein n=1 Tax=Photinus pyralis TaxID=7054 RepID=A0A1Y1M4J9_PHOPY